MCGEGLFLRNTWRGDKIVIGLQHVGAIAHRRQVLDLLTKSSISFDRPSATGKAEDLANDRFHR